MSEMLDPKNSSNHENLPSRAELHGKGKYKKKNKKNSKREEKKFNFSIPLILLVIMLLLPLSVIIYLNKDNLPTVKTAASSAGQVISFDEHEIPNDSKKQEEDEIKETPKNEENKDEMKDTVTKEENKDDREEYSKEDSNKDSSTTNIQQVTNKEDTTEKIKEETKPTPQNENRETIFHTVQKGETLYRISMHYYKSQEGIERIQNANGLVGNEISVGQKLKIPLP